MAAGPWARLGTFQYLGVTPVYAEDTTTILWYEVELLDRARAVGTGATIEEAITNALLELRETLREEVTP